MNSKAEEVAARDRPRLGWEEGVKNSLKKSKYGKADKPLIPLAALSVRKGQNSRKITISWWGW